MNTSTRCSDFADCILEAAFDLSQVHSRWVGFLLATGVLLVVGLLDTAMFRGTVALALPYAIPVAIASWMISRRVGLLFALTTCFTWVLVGVKTDTLPTDAFSIFVTALVRITNLSLLAVFTSSMNRYVGFHRSDALTDQLTGLANRRALLQRLKLEIDRSARTGRPISVMMGDLDNFKKVNDKAGHDAGDCLLQRTAAALLGHFRSTDLVSRYGGDEFVVLLPETGNKEALELAQRGIDVVGAVLAESYQSGISLGVVTFVQAPTSAEAVFAAADEMLYAAKAKTSHRIVSRVVA